MMSVHAIPFVLQRDVSGTCVRRMRRFLTYHSALLIAGIDMVRHRQYTRDGCRRRGRRWITVIEHIDEVRRPFTGY